MSFAGWVLGCLAIGLPTIVVAQPLLIPVERVVITGGSVFSEQEFAALTHALQHQSVTLGQLQGLVTTINQRYQEKGYITSRAILVPQQIRSGVVEIQIIEGTVERIEIKRTERSSHRLQDAYLRDRVALGLSNPLNFLRLEEELQKLRANPLIAEIKANLRAGTTEGQSILELVVTEAPSLRTQISTDNYGNPSTGIYRGSVTLQEQNLLGWGDRLGASYTRSGSSNTFSGLYALPLNPQGGTLTLQAQSGVNPIVEGNLTFSLETQTRLLDLTYRQPLIHNLRQELAVSFGVGLEESQILVDGAPFPEGETRSTVLRLGQEYVSRDSLGGWFVRSSIGWGLDAQGSTTRSGSPDGQFWVWNGQVLRLQRFSSDSETLAQFRLNVQYGGDALPPLNRFSLGGPLSVRGYRQGLVTGDRGVQGSIEFQFPIVRNGQGKGVVQLFPFIEGGTVWNQNGGAASQSLLGTGIGLGWNATKQFTLRLDYGVPLIPAENPSNTLQDSGLYFSVSGNF